MGAALGEVCLDSPLNSHRHSRSPPDSQGYQSSILALEGCESVTPALAPVVLNTVFHFVD